MRLSDERQQLLEEASEIVADGPEDDPLTSDVIDAALTHLIDRAEDDELPFGRSAVLGPTVQ